MYICCSKYKIKKNHYPIVFNSPTSRNPSQHIGNYLYHPPLQEHMILPAKCVYFYRMVLRTK